MPGDFGLDAAQFIPPADAAAFAASKEALQTPFASGENSKETSAGWVSADGRRYARVEDRYRNKLAAADRQDTGEMLFAKNFVTLNGKEYIIVGPDAATGDIQLVENKRSDLNKDGGIGLDDVSIMRNSLVDAPVRKVAIDALGQARGWEMKGTDLVDTLSYYHPYWDWVDHGWLRYKVDAAHDGEYEIGLYAKNDNPPDQVMPPGYRFELQVFVDGEYKGIAEIEGDSINYRDGFLKVALESGVHDVEFRWINDMVYGGVDSNLRVKEFFMRAPDHRGDLNGDGYVDQQDIPLFKQQTGATLDIQRLELKGKPYFVLVHQIK